MALIKLPSYSLVPREQSRCRFSPAVNQQILRFFLSFYASSDREGYLRVFFFVSPYFGDLFCSRWVVLDRFCSGLFRDSQRHFDADFFISIRVCTDWGVLVFSYDTIVSSYVELIVSIFIDLLLLISLCA